MTTLTELLAIFSESPRTAYEPTLAALPALLDAAPDALRSGEGAALVEKVISESRADGLGADVLELILERGAIAPSLGSILSLWCHDEAQRLRLVRRALALGATPADANGKTTVLASAAAS